MSSASNPRPDTADRSAFLGVLARNAAANLSQSGATWLILLFLPPLLVRVLDRQTYATWMLLLQLGAYIVLIDAGIQGAIARFVARAEGLNDERYLGGVLSSAGAVLVATGALAAAVVAVMAWLLPHIFRSIPVSIVPDSRRALLIVGWSLAAALPFSTLAGYFRGYLRNEILAVSTVTGKFCGAVGIGWAAWHHQGLAAMAAWSAAGNLIAPAAYALVWGRSGRTALIRLHYVGFRVAREFLTFCGAMLASQLATLLITGLDMPVVVAFDFRSAAYYAVATTASNMLIAPQGAILSALLPVTSSLSARTTPEQMGAALRKVTRYGTSILILLTMPLLFGMPAFLRLWVGGNYEAHALLFAEVLVIAQFIRLCMLPYAVIGFSVGQQHRMLVSPSVEGVVNLICSVILVREMGALGVALGTLIGAIIGVALHFANSIPRTDKIAVSRKDLISRDILRPVLFIAPVAALLAGMQMFRVPRMPFLLAVSVCEVVAAAVLFRFLLGKQEREEIIQFCRNLLLSVTRRLTPSR